MIFLFSLILVRDARWVWRACSRSRRQNKKLQFQHGGVTAKVKIKVLRVMVDDKSRFAMRRFAMTCDFRLLLLPLCRSTRAAGTPHPLRLRRRADACPCPRVRARVVPRPCCTPSTVRLPSALAGPPSPPQPEEQQLHGPPPAQRRRHMRTLTCMHAPRLAHASVSHTASRVCGPRTSF